MQLAYLRTRHEFPHFRCSCRLYSRSYFELYYSYRNLAGSSSFFSRRNGRIIACRTCTRTRCMQAITRHRSHRRHSQGSHIERSWASTWLHTWDESACTHWSRDASKRTRFDVEKMVSRHIGCMTVHPLENNEGQRWHEIDAVLRNS